MSRKFVVGCVVCFGALCANLARAELTTYTFQGELWFVSPSFSGVLSVGDPITGSFSFDSATPDSVADPANGLYRPSVSVSMSNPLAFSFTSPASTSSISVANGSTDLFAVALGPLGAGPVVGGLRLSGWELAVLDTAGAMLNSDSANGPLMFSFADYASLEVFFAGGNFISTLTSFQLASPVPEPESYAMLLAGLGVLGFIVRRRKQNTRPGNR
ncbi:MAG: PEP-CTERM sorting domain-containing protein [Burkholderiales bacterium]